MDANTKREIVASVCYESFKRHKLERRGENYYMKKLNYGSNAYIRRTNVGGLDEYLYHVELRKEGKLKYEVHVYGYDHDKMGKYSGLQYKKYEDMVLQSEIFDKKSTRQINNHVTEEVIERLIEVSR